MALQGIELVRLQGVGFEQLVLSELLKGGVRRAPQAFLLCAKDAAHAYVEAAGFARWAALTMVDDAAMPLASAARARAHIEELETHIEPEGVAAFLTRSPAGPRAASAYRRLVKLHQANPAEFDVWAPLLSRVLDAAFWSEVDASHGPAKREIELRCVRLLDRE